MTLKNLILFDVDETLTKSRKKIETDTINMINNLKNLNNIDIGIVGGSDLDKQKEQLGDEVINLFDWVFPENGLTAFKGNELINKTSFKDFMGEDKLNELINTVLEYFSKLILPVKRGTFIEFRNGMINICPVGRSCSQQEREDFFEYDKINNIRNKTVKYLEDKLSHLNLSFSIGGQISIDIFPKGWDKTYCLKFVDDKYDKIYFFGDKTLKGGNDYEIYIHPRTTSFNVKNPKDTINKINKFFF